MRRPFPHLEAKTRGSKMKVGVKKIEAKKRGSKNVVFSCSSLFFALTFFCSHVFCLLNVKMFFFAREQTWYPKTEPRLGLC